MPAMQRSCALARVMSAPLRRISPLSASRLPAIRLKSVVLPAPLGPMMPTASPRATPRSTASAALTEPKDLERPLISRSIAARQLEPPVIPDGALRAKGERRSDPGPREADSDSFREVPDSLACGSVSGMTGVSASGASGDRLHLAAHRDVGGCLVLGDDDVVAVAVPDPPLAADEAGLGDVLGGDGRNTLAVPLDVADHGVELRGPDRLYRRPGVADL